MKRVALLTAGCLAALGACSTKNRAKYETGRTPNAFNQPDLIITETPSNPDGGKILGKDKQIISVSPQLDLTGPINDPFLLNDQSITFAGVALTETMTLQEIVTALDENPQASAGTGRTFYIFAKHGLVAVSTAKTDGTTDLATAPDYFYVSSSNGFKGAFTAPESLGKIALGKKLAVTGDLSLQSLEAFTRTWGSAIFKNAVDAGSQVNPGLDCFSAAKCKVEAENTGGFSISFPMATFNVTSDGTLESVFFGSSPAKAERLVGAFSGAAVTESFVYGLNIAGVNLESTRAELKTTFGGLTITNNKAVLSNGGIEVSFDAKTGLTSGIVVTDAFKGKFLALTTTEASIQLGQVLPEATFDCASVTEIAVKKVEAFPVPGFEKCAASATQIDLSMQGGVLSFTQRDNADKTAKEVVFSRYALKKRAVIYGHSIAGIKLGDTYGSIASKYGRNLGYKEITPNKTVEITFAVKGLTVQLDISAQGSQKVSSVSLSGESGVDVYNSAFEKITALGKADFRFQGDEKTSSFENFVTKLDKSFLEPIPAEVAPIATPGTNAPANAAAEPMAPALAPATGDSRFKVECATKDAATCSLLTTDGDTGSLTTIIVGPRAPATGTAMTFEFNEKNALTKVSL